MMIHIENSEDTSMAARSECATSTSRRERPEASQSERPRNGFSLPRPSDEQVDEGTGIPIAILDEYPAIFLIGNVSIQARSFPQSEF
ncbi:hypothetical protein [Paraburkholderia phenoliruptrix]|uniref:hypothetical protein n=1 Tax=Paraburkholderia phenoliruptrix TaxID=252970 RepID=UPI002869EA53|nr:hypothetical protein [Paraburkholderia phenoliruptrix]WMY11056.1 hypothetical protein P3F88_30825 [Paraburkholderia phenoliruptrix]